MQSKLHSLIEALANTFIGYGISLVVQIYLFKQVGCIVTLEENILIGIVFMVVSIIRGFALRRGFVWYYARSERFK